MQKPLNLVKFRVGRVLSSIGAVSLEWKLLRLRNPAQKSAKHRDFRVSSRMSQLVHVLRKFCTFFNANFACFRKIARKYLKITQKHAQFKRKRAKLAQKTCKIRESRVTKPDAHEPKAFPYSERSVTLFRVLCEVRVTG